MNEGVPVIKAFVNLVKTQFGASVKTLRSDNALEFCRDKEILSFFAALGITHERRCVQTPQQNGVVERKHKDLLEVSRVEKLTNPLALPD